jgi:hypothetical protein
MAAPFWPPCGGPFADRFITGAAVRTARRHGPDVPADRMILSLIAAIRPRQEIE